MIVLNFHDALIGVDVHDLDKFLDLVTPVSFNYETRVYEIRKLDLALKEVNAADIVGHIVASQKDEQIIKLHSVIESQIKLISELRVQLESQDKQKQTEEKPIVC